LANFFNVNFSITRQIDINPQKLNRIFEQTGEEERRNFRKIIIGSRAEQEVKEAYKKKNLNPDIRKDGNN
jgi:hypothetical protein